MLLSHRWWKIALILASAVFGSSCATVFSGTTDEVRIESAPEGATFTVVTNGGGINGSEGEVVATGTTPDVVELERKNKYVVRLKLDGYKETKVSINQNFNTWVVCSVLCGLIPVGVDLLSGAFFELKRKQVLVTLVPARNLRPKPPEPAEAEDEEESSLHYDHQDPDGMFVVLITRDDAGQLRQLAVPLIPEGS